MTYLSVLAFSLVAGLAANSSVVHAQSDDQRPSVVQNHPVSTQRLDDIFKNWLRELERGAGISANARDVILHRTGDELLISNLTLSDPALDLTVTVQSAVLSALDQTQKGFAIGADKLVLGNLRLKLGETEFHADIATLTNVGLPSITLKSRAPGGGSETKFERKRRFLNEFLGLTAETISIPKLVVRTYSDKEVDEVLAESRYANNQLSSVGDKKIGHWSISSGQSLSPPLEPLIQERFRKASISNFDFSPILKLFDSETGGTSRARLVELVQMTNYKMSVGGLDIGIDDIHVGDVTLAELDGKTEDQLIKIIESPKDLDALSSKELPPFFLELASISSIGELSVKGFKLGALSIERFGFDDLSLSELSLKGAEKIALSGFAAELVDLGVFSLGRFSLDGLALPEKPILLAALNGEKPSTSDLLPMLAGLSVSGFHADIQELDLKGSLNALSLTTTTSSAGVPTGIDFTLSELAIPSSLLPNNGTLVGRFGGIVETLGMETVEIDQKISMIFDASSKTLSVPEFQTNIAKLGGVNLTANIEGIERSPFANPATAARDIRKGKLTGTKITFDNKGVVEAGFDAQAQKLGTKGDTLRNQVGATLPFLVGVLQNPPFQKELVTALQAFLPAPESLIVELKPSSPVAIADIERQSRGDPRKLIELLGATIRNNKAEQPADTKTPAE